MANRIDVNRCAHGCNTAWRAYVAAWLIGGLLWALAAWAAASPIPVELTGVVLDSDTKKPLEGAYVLAAYHEQVRGIAAVKQWCIKTKGMVTGVDGKFRFPVEKLDGLSPAGVDGIKQGYYLQFVTYPDQAVFKRQDAKAYADRVVYLSKQDANKPTFVYGSEDPYCYRARSAADARAGVEFLTIRLAEMTRFGAGAQQVGAVRDMISDLEGLDRAAPGSVDRGTRR